MNWFIAAISAVVADPVVPNCPHRSVRSGFTLLEVLVAFSLLSLLLTVIIQSQSESAFFLERTEKLFRVQQVVVNELLIAERDPTGREFGIGSGVFPSEHPLAGDRWEREIRIEDFMLGMIEVERLIYRVIWEGRRGQGEQAFESSILREVR
jgi:prepilin-type N-terminal cleavage/methylation domain-containing protein